MLKSRRHPQNSKFTATELTTDVSLVVLGYSVGLLGSNMQHAAVNLLKTSWAPLNSCYFIQWSHRSFRFVVLSL